jgi:septal ring factor EnvC (AmiA/AmiB activator)
LLQFALALLLGLFAQGSDSLDARLEQTRLRIAELEARQAAASEVILAIQDHLAVARTYYTRLATEESALLAAIGRIDARAALQESARADLSGSLDEYLIYVYSHRRMIGAEALFAEGGLSRVLRREAYLDFLARRAAGEIEVLRERSDSLDRYRDSLLVLQDGVTRLRRQMQQIQERILYEEERQAMLRLELGGEIALAQDSAAALEQARMQVSALVTGLRVTSSAPVVGVPLPEPSVDSWLEVNRGSVPWPASGEVVRSFGVEVDPLYGTLTTSDGVSITTSPSAGVVAVGPGVVLYAREFLSMGRLVVIDHRDGYYSVYGHMGSVEVSVGDEVVAGTPLGTSGTIEGGLSGCYFEIRRGGQPVDPAGYLQ